MTIEAMVTLRVGSQNLTDNFLIINTLYLIEVRYFWGEPHSPHCQKTRFFSFVLESNLILFLSSFAQSTLVLFEQSAPKHF